METTLISDDILFRGEVKYSGDLQIDGKVEGRIDSDGHLQINPEGDVKAQIKVRQVSIKGKLQGNVSGELITLTSSGKVYGDIECKQLQIERGGFHNGVTLMS